MRSEQPEDLMTAAELAARLKLTTTTVLKWHRNGRIPARKLSHKVLRFCLPDVVAALEARPKADGKGVAK